MRLLSFFIVACILFSCKPNPNYNTGNVGICLKNKYAKGFSISHDSDLVKIEVKNPWQKADNVTITYWLAKQGQVIPTYINPENVIRIPLHRVVCMSTTHIAFVSSLKQEPSIVGISGKNLISNAYVNNKIAEGKVVDVGYEQSLNYEQLVKLKPDVVFAYGVGADVTGTLSKLKELGIKVVLIAEYLETQPLAKAEWLRFVAEFYDQTQEADSVFNIISSDYERLKNLTSTIKNKPKVMAGLPFNGTWFISGGKSYFATLISDAGGEYIWDKLDSHESLPISWENVMEKSTGADVWLNIGSAVTKNDIVATDNRLTTVKPYITGAVYNNTAMMTKAGGNDYWESGVVQPNIILNDIIAILHPELTSGYSLHYYKQLK